MSASARRISSMTPHATRDCRAYPWTSGRPGASPAGVARPTLLESSPASGQGHSAEGRPDLCRPRKALGREPPGLGALADPLRELAHRHRERTSGGVEPSQAVLAREHASIRQAALLEALQDDALAAGHLVQLLERED